MRKDWLRLPLIPLLLIIFFMDIPTTYSVKTVEEYVDFYANIQYALGHMNAAIESLEMENIDLAISHSLHPVEENLPLLRGYINEVDPQLLVEFEDSLNLFKRVVEEGDVDEARKVLNDIESLMEHTSQLVIPNIIYNGFLFRVKVIIKVLELAEEEYGEGVAEDGIRDMEEYLDAKYFIVRARHLYEGIKHAIVMEEAKEIDDFFDELISSVEDASPPDDVERFFRGIVVELTEVSGLIVEEETDVDILDNLKALLDEIISKYRAGDYEEAEALVIEAYLENYEVIEGDVKKIDPELNDEIETKLRDMLRKLIVDRAPISQVESLVDDLRRIFDDLKVRLGDGQEMVEPVEEVETGFFKTLPWMAGTAVFLTISIIQAFVIYKLKSGG